MTASTIAGALVDALAAFGVKRMFGIPGGGSSLDIIEAGAQRGVDFVLARTETSATFMAAASAEITGVPGVVLTGLGPGAAAAANGVAYAHLDRAPVVILTDCFDAERDAYVSHQAVDHGAMFGPIAKGSMMLKAGDSAADIVALLERSVAHPQGPVHFDLSSRQAAAPAKGPVQRRAPNPAPIDADALAAAKRLLANAKRPAVIVGVQAREESDAVRRFAEAVKPAVLATYKAKGIVAESGPHTVGLTTGGALEAPTLSQADLIILVGFDPIELIPQPWRYKAPLIEIGRVGGLPHYKTPDVSLIGPLAPALDALRAQTCDSQWKPDEIKTLKAKMRDALRVDAAHGLSPSALVEAVARKAPRGARATVDAGAHMFSAMGFWQADEPSGVLISNGLSTMAYALPSAIGSSLVEPERPVVCFTGDGGLLMCVSELATAVEQHSKIVVVVFNDGALSLIDIKQQKRQMPTRGVRYGAIDFATIAQGFGCHSWRATNASELDRALDEAFAGDGPALIDVQVDPGAYPRQIEAMRG